MSRVESPVGSLPIGRKRGRPTNPSLVANRQVFPEWSERTIARFTVAMRRLDVMGYTFDEKVAVVKRVTRTNGTVRVARLDEYTEDLAAMWIVREVKRGRGREHVPDLVLTV